MFGKRDEATEHTIPIKSEREIDLGPIGGRTVVGRQTLVRGVVKGEGPIIIRGAVEGKSFFGARSVLRRVAGWTPTCRRMRSRSPVRRRARCARPRAF